MSKSKKAFGDLSADAKIKYLKSENDSLKNDIKILRDNIYFLQKILKERLDTEFEFETDKLERENREQKQKELEQRKQDMINEEKDFLDTTTDILKTSPIKNELFSIDNNKLTCIKTQDGDTKKWIPASLKDWDFFKKSGKYTFKFMVHLKNGNENNPFNNEIFGKFGFGFNSNQFNRYIYYGNGTKVVIKNKKKDSEKKISDDAKIIDGDVITMEIELKNGVYKVKFIRNDNDLGYLFDNIKLKTSMFGAEQSFRVVLYFQDNGDMMKIISYTFEAYEETAKKPDKKGAKKTDKKADKKTDDVKSDTKEEETPKKTDDTKKKDKKKSSGGWFSKKKDDTTETQGNDVGNTDNKTTDDDDVDANDDDDIINDASDNDDEIETNDQALLYKDGSVYDNDKFDLILNEVSNMYLIKMTDDNAKGKFVSMYTNNIITKEYDVYKLKFKIIKLISNGAIAFGIISNNDTDINNIKMGKSRHYTLLGSGIKFYNNPDDNSKPKKEKLLNKDIKQGNIIKIKVDMKNKQLFVRINDDKKYKLMYKNININEYYRFGFHFRSKNDTIKVLSFKKSIKKNDVNISKDKAQQTTLGLWGNDDDNDGNHVDDQNL